MVAGAFEKILGPIHWMTRAIEEISSIFSLSSQSDKAEKMPGMSPRVP
jgi:hypothetical protein